MLSVLSNYWFAALPGLGVVGAALVWLVGRYRGSVARDVQPFRQYILGNIKLSVGRRFSPILARQFGLRSYASRSLASFPAHLAVPSVDRLRLELDKAYIRLSLAAAPQRRMQDATLLSPDAASALIFGEPGSGKSSLTRKLFREACMQAYLRPYQNRLPVHLELRTVPWSSMLESEESPEVWLLRVIETAVTSLKGVHAPEFLYQAFQSGPGVIVFLDGLDEIPSAHLYPATSAIEAAVKALRQHSTSSMVVVTSRTQLRGLLPRAFINAFRQVLTVEPFTPADVFSFLRRWPFSGARLVESQRIFQRLRENASLMEMCSNPLVLSMYVAQDQRFSDVASLERLPDRRTEFYGEVIGELLFFRREEQLGRAVAGGQLRRDREQLLGAIALDHLAKTDDPANSVSFHRAVALTRRHFGLSTDAEAAAELVKLSIDTGLFTEERPAESLRFMHLSLCEYLAAKELADADDGTFNLTLSAALNDTQSAAELEGVGRRLWETVTFSVALTARARRNWSLNVALRGSW